MVAAQHLGTIFFGTAVVSYVAVALFRVLARRWELVDIPNERSSHLIPVPLGAGIVVVAINIIAWLVFGGTGGDLAASHAIVLACGGLLIAGVSLVDDLGHVPYPIRLGIQTIAALLVVLGYGFWHACNVPLLGIVTLGPVGPLLTVLWIVGLTNAYNFMDGIDGMAAGQATAAGLGWVLIGLITGIPVLAVLGSVLAASSLGLLGHNWQPARVFMGDVGATFLGYSLAVMPIIGARQDPRLALTGVLLVWPAIFDSLFTVLRRLRKHENIFVGHRSFLFHRLVHVGWSHAAVSSLYLVFPVVGALLAFQWEHGTRPEHIAMMIVVSGLAIGLWQLVRQQEKALARRSAARAYLVEKVSRDREVRWEQREAERAREG